MSLHVDFVLVFLNVEVVGMVLHNVVSEGYVQAVIGEIDLCDVCISNIIVLLSLQCFVINGEWWGLSGQQELHL